MIFFFVYVAYIWVKKLILVQISSHQQYSIVFHFVDTYCFFLIKKLILAVVFFDFERLGHLATRAKMFKWSLSQWLHREKSRRFAWGMTLQWQFCLRSRICFMIISNSGLLRFVLLIERQNFKLICFN